MARLGHHDRVLPFDLDNYAQIDRGVGAYPQAGFGSFDNVGRNLSRVPATG